jgi:hypothetical protein
MAQLLDERTQVSVGLAAAYLGKCQPCFKYLREQAQRAGLSAEYIREVVKLAETIRTKGDGFMAKYVDQSLGVNEATRPETTPGGAECCSGNSGTSSGCC